jgi:hypothetical protein
MLPLLGSPVGVSTLDVVTRLRNEFITLFTLTESHSATSGKRALKETDSI